MKARPTCLDFETEAIEKRPTYPPKPVGFSLKDPSERKSRYYAWGHPTGNNCTLTDAKRVLQQAWRGAEGGVLMHNGKFDVDVATTHMGCPELSWDKYHDTMFLAFLDDPHAQSFGLKPRAEVVLDMPSDERDFLKEWIIANVPEARQKPSTWGAYICRAPGDMVGKYADGDVMRTHKLFEKLHKKIRQQGMEQAYDRERRLMPILLENERVGVRLDMDRLRKDIDIYEAALVKVEMWLYKKLKSPGLNFDSNEDLANAIVKVDKDATFLLTATGQRSVSKESLAQAVKNKQLFLALGYRSRLTTCLGIFMRNWLEIGERTGGYLQPSWSQIRQMKSEKDSKGARTGRLICAEPNLLNLSKDFEGRNDGYTHPEFLGVPKLPLVRVYLLPDKGGVWCHRDFASQELRVLAHFEDGSLCRQYAEDPKLDVHAFVQGEIQRIANLTTERRQTKILNFGMIYGQGYGSLAEAMGVTVDVAKQLKMAQRKALPDLGTLEKEVKDIAKAGSAVRTWGGRLYKAEDPKIIKGRMVDFCYKTLNHLIQGSAADCTKEAVIRYHDVRKDGRFLVTVYDELNNSAPKKSYKQEMKLMNEVMASVEFDVPMLSDGKTGTCWGELVKYVDGPCAP